MKEEALKLADSIDEFAQGGYSYKPSDFLKVSAMIRKLVEELDKKPLSDDEIEVFKEIIRISDRKHDLWDKAKDILERHGIK